MLALHQSKIGEVQTQQGEAPLVVAQKSNMAIAGPPKSGQSLILAVTPGVASISTTL